MKNPFGFGLVLAATASLAVAGGDDEKNKKKDYTSRLDSLSSSAVPQGPGTTVKAAAGKGVTIDVGDEFQLKLKNRIQVKYEFASLEFFEDINNFSIRRARTSFEGFVFNKDITYKMQLEWATAASNLLDAWVKWAFWKNENHNAIALRAGAQKTLFGLESTGSSGNLAFVERSLATRTFSDRRQTGANLYGSHGEGQKFTWFAGAMSNGVAAAATNKLGGSANNQANDDGELDFNAGVRFDGKGFLGDEGYVQSDLREAGKQELMYTVGAGVAVGNYRNAANTADIESTSFNINGAVHVSGWSFQGEYFMRSDDLDGGTETDSMGWYVDATYTLQPQGDSKSRWGFGARVGMVSNDDPAQNVMRPIILGAAEGDITEIDLGVINYYRGDNSMKTILNYTYQDVEFQGGVGDQTNHGIALLFQLAF